MSNSLNYAKVYDQSIHQPERFWGEAAEEVQWIRKWDRVLDEGRKPFYRWFAGGELDTCYNCFDCHVENGRA